MPAGCEEQPRPGDLWVLRRGLPVLLGIGAAAGLAILFLFNPSQHGFYPVCFLHVTTGLQCPGCGSLRALHQLLHGNLGEALRFNPLVVLSIPIVAGIALRLWLLRRRGQPARFNPRPGWIWAVVVVLVVFTFVRNFLIPPS